MTREELVLVSVVRAAYRVAWKALQSEKAVDHVANIAAAWRTGNRSDVIVALGLLRYELYNTVWACETHQELCAACLGVA